MSELMDLFLAGKDQPQADQLNDLAEGHPPFVRRPISSDANMLRGFYAQANSEDAFHFLQKQTIGTYRLSRTSSQTTWLKIKSHCNDYNQCTSHNVIGTELQEDDSMMMVVRQQSYCSLNWLLLSLLPKNTKSQCNKLI
eukprot:908379-Pelagomonas_calceolata.AAC.1